MDTIAIIGAGNLGSAVTKGLIASKVINPKQIYLTRRNITLLDELKKTGVQTGNCNIKACENANIIILAVKPFQIPNVVKEIAPYVKPNTIVISLAAGTQLDAIESLGLKDLSLFHVIPNTAIEVLQSMTCISSHNASSEAVAKVKYLFDQVGTTLFLQKEQMHAATVIASCGLAFALRYIRAATLGGVQIGLKNEIASQLVAETLKGAAELIIKNQTHPEFEIDKVTTPNGVTIKGLNEMESYGFSDSVIKGIVKSNNNG